MNAPIAKPRGILRPPPAVAAVAFLAVAVLLACASEYGYFRDELYYLACARRLAWGYVDHPPFSFALLAVTSGLYGDTRLSIRLVPAVAAALVIVLTGRITKRFGAPPIAQALAGLSLLVAPGLLTLDHTFSMGSFSVLFAVAAAGLLLRAMTADPGESTLPWIRVGVMVGLGGLNQLSMLGAAAAVLVGLASTASRSVLKERGPWLALGFAAVAMAPYLAWQRAHGWPTLPLLVPHLPSGGGLFGWLGASALSVGPVNIAVAGIGLWGLLRSQRLVEFRFFGVAAVLWILVCPFAGASPSALLVATPVLFAAGAAILHPWLESVRWRYVVCALCLGVSGIIAAPFAIPLLRVAHYQAYARALHLSPRNGDPAGEPASFAPLPEHFADMYGWPELARAVANVAVALPPLDRDDAVVLASNAGEAGALELFGAAVGLPPIISGHNQYWPWGTAGGSGRVVIAVGGDETLLRASFRSVELATVYGHTLAAPSERHVKVFVCRDSVEPLDVLWPRFKHYD